MAYSTNVLLNYCITQYFGENPQIYKQFGLNGHNGIDLVWYGNEYFDNYVFAVFPGLCVEVGNQGNQGYGIFVRVNNYDFGLQIVYAHLKLSKIKKGDIITYNQHIAIADNTGFSTGPHLHFGVREINEKGEILNYNNGYKGYIDPLTIPEKKMNSDTKFKINEVNSRGEFESISLMFFGYKLNKDKDWEFWGNKDWGTVTTEWLQHENCIRWQRFVKNCAENLDKCIEEKKKYKNLYDEEIIRRDSLKNNLVGKIKLLFNL